MARHHTTASALVQDHLPPGYQVREKGVEAPLSPIIRIPPLGESSESSDSMPTALAKNEVSDSCAFGDDYKCNIATSKSPQKL